MPTPNNTNTSDTLAHYRTLLNDVTTKDYFRLSRQISALKKTFAGESTEQKNKIAWDTLT
ncbi:MAG: hypothetical protein ACJA0C_001440, partial [Candidatus Endobugula sp.]